MLILRRALPYLVLLVLVTALYGPYISNWIFFDDITFFDNPGGYAAGYLDAWEPTLRRWVSFGSMALTWRLWGNAYEPYHIISLILHGLVACSIYLFVRDLLSKRGVENAQRPTLIAAALFALHPVAVFAAGAIIQRSILMATLFSIWMWIAVWRGVTRKQGYWLVLSVFFYYGAVFSKEHAITAAGVALLVGWEAAEGDWRRMLRVLALPLLGWLAVAITIVLTMRGVIGSGYEPILAEMALPDDATNEPGFLFRSIINQTFLWFKYVLLWVLPNENWMAVDLRVPFPNKWHAFPWILGAVAYVVYPLVVVAAHCRKHISRLMVLALLSPWLLFFAQFSAIQYQESFVLYRSYLWAVPGVLLLALLIAKLKPKSQWLALALVGPVLFGLSWSRLQTFSHPLFVWDEAVTRLDGHDELPGAYRVYYNSSLEFMRLGKLDRAIQDIDKVIALSPTLPYGYSARGVASLNKRQYLAALPDFEKAISLNSTVPAFYIGKGRALIGIGQRQEGLALLQSTCESTHFGCEFYEYALKTKPINSKVPSSN